MTGASAHLTSLISLVESSLGGWFMNLSRLNAREIETQARALELQLKKLAHRPRPTPSERQLTVELKKMRLVIKDRLDALKRS